MTSLRSMSMAAVAVPFALASGLTNRSDDQRPKPLRAGVASQQTAPAVHFLTEFRFIPLRSNAVAPTQATADVGIFRDNEDLQAQSSASDATDRSVNVDWLTPTLTQVMELYHSAVADLPNGQPIKQLALASVVQVALDLQSSGVPPPQVAPRGDGGLQLVWYTPKRDLEIEVYPRGNLEIVEFDGSQTVRKPFSVDEALAASRRLVASLA